MEALVTITGCVVYIALSLCLSALAFWGFVAAFRWIDWQVAIIIFRHSQVAKAMLEVADNLAMRIMRDSGKQPFDKGSRIYRKKYEQYHRYAKVVFPRGYKEANDE